MEQLNKVRLNLSSKWFWNYNTIKLAHHFYISSRTAFPWDVDKDYSVKITQIKGTNKSALVKDS